MKPLTVLGYVVRVPPLLVGGFLAGAVVWMHFAYLPVFTAPRYRAFWDDLTAYHLRTDGHKSLDQLDAEYDPELVHECAVVNSLSLALIPSDKSATAYWVGYAMKNAAGDPPRRAADVFPVLPIVATVLAVPLMMFVGLLTRNLAWALCRSEWTMALYAEHYDVPLSRRVGGALATVPLVVALAAASAYPDWTPELRRAGFTLVDLTVIAVAQSYLGGAVVRFVRGLIDAGFLAAGVNPERVVWDDLLAVAIMAPVLILVYGNSPPGILADLVAGVGPRLLLKLWQRLRPARTGELLEVEEVADGRGAVRRNWGLAAGAAAVGLLFLACGGFATISNLKQAPTTVTAADLEAHGVPPRMTWVAVNDGYLFWPLLTAVPEQTRPDRAERYVVPLVSRETRDAWVVESRRGTAARYKSTHTRPLVTFRPKELERLFPGVAPGRFDPDRPWAEHRISGRPGPLSAERERFRRAVRPGDVAASAVLVIENDYRPASIRGMGLGYALVGLVALLPLPLRWLLAGRGPRPTPAPGREPVRPRVP